MKRMKVRTVWIAVAAHALGIGAAAPALGQAEKKDVAQGQKLFMSEACHFCHSIKGEGNKLHPLDGVGSKLSADDIRQWIRDPKAMAAKAHITLKPEMPPFASKLTKEQIDALADYLETLKKQ
jgi:mono/diheme cytochrome c family protein